MQQQQKIIIVRDTLNNKSQRVCILKKRTARTPYLTQVCCNCRKIFLERSQRGKQKIHTVASTNLFRETFFLFTGQVLFREQVLFRSQVSSIEQVLFRGQIVFSEQLLVKGQFY